MGAIDEAEELLGTIDRERIDSSALATEVWSLAGRIAKERYSAARNKTSANAREYARTAIAAYQRAFGIGNSAYPAVNAATMAMLANDSALAQTLARRALAAPGEDRTITGTTRARAKPICSLGELDDARMHYTTAHRLAGNRFGDIASMRRQLLLIGSASAIDLLDAVRRPVSSRSPGT